MYWSSNALKSRVEHVFNILIKLRLRAMRSTWHSAWKLLFASSQLQVQDFYCDHQAIVQPAIEYFAKNPNS
jgi:hypothetical protein